MRRIHSESEAAAWLGEQTCSCGARRFGRDPVLVDEDGTLVLRFQGCARCEQPPHFDARLPEALDKAVPPKARVPRVLDPDLVAALQPLVEGGFPRYAPARAQPIDASPAPLGGDWQIVEWLRGSLGYGQARCVRRDGARAVATFSTTQAQPLERVAEKLKLTARGVVAMLDVRSAGEYAVLFEAEPRGATLASAMFPLHVDIGALLFGKLLAIVADAHGRGELLRGIRPETIYLGSDFVVSIAPRGELFAGGAKQSRDLNAAYPFPAIYQPPDMMSGKATTASDVFSCCAVLLFALTRKPPYDAPSPMWQLGAMMSGPPPMPPGLDPRLAELVRAGLDPNPAKRPSAVELASVLDAS